MRVENCDIAVLGSGAAGAAIAHELVQRQAGSVTVLYQQTIRGSSLTNQKWKHSGLFYPREDLARELWNAFRGMHDLERQYLQRPGAAFFFENRQCFEETGSLWQQWKLSEWEAQAGPLTPTEAAIHPRLGMPACGGGYRVPDAVLDFPALLDALRERIAAGGARVVPTARVTELVREGSRLEGVIYEDRGETVLLRSRRAVLAMGGWSQDLLACIGISIPMRRWKSHVLTCEGELVGQITAWMDGRQLRLVPFRGQTIIHDGRVEPARHGDDLTPSAEGEAALKEELAARFPAVDRRVLDGSSVHACIKTEEDDGGGRRSRSPKIYTAAPRPGIPGHGVEGLVVAFPGKASLMFPLAREVARLLG